MTDPEIHIVGREDGTNHKMVLIDDYRALEREIARLAPLEREVARLREFALNAPQCAEPTEENHYGWPKDGVRWRCFTCNEWCYPEAPCYGCDARAMFATLQRCQGCADAPVGQHTGPHDWETP